MNSVRLPRLIISRPGSAVLFPDPDTGGYGDVVAVGADLRAETLKSAYRQGIFPWPHEGYPLLWFSPLQRAVLEFDRLHIPRRLERIRHQQPFEFTIDTAFERVIDACSSVPRSGQEGTWITPAMRSAYVRLHHQGIAHSVEAWDANGTLVGGLYGVDGGGVFSGESMFHRVPNASKLALLHLTEHLARRGLTFIDIQQLTPHMAALGAREIPRNDFLRCWQKTQQKGLTLFGQPAL